MLGIAEVVREQAPRHALGVRRGEVSAEAAWPGPLTREGVCRWPSDSASRTPSHTNSLRQCVQHFFTLDFFFLQTSSFYFQQNQNFSNRIKASELFLSIPVTVPEFRALSSAGLEYDPML